MGNCPVCNKNKKNMAQISNDQSPNNIEINKMLNKLCKTCRRIAFKGIDKNITGKNNNDLYAIVNGLLTSAEIRQIRKNLNLTQKQAARICGGGPNAFSRYERGTAVPLRATSNLLRLLDKYPKEVEYLAEFSL